MAAGFKDSSEVVQFRRLFARVKDWSDDNPIGLRELAFADDSFQKLAVEILRAAGKIQQSERSDRDLFTGPVDPKFISEWREFEERFAGALLDILSDTLREIFISSRSITIIVPNVGRLPI